MIKNLTIALFAVIYLTACDWKDVASSGAGASKGDADPEAAEMAATTNPDTTTPATTTSTAATTVTTVARASATSAEKECAAGRYDFRTDSDNKKHFDFQFLPGGLVRYNLTNGPTGSWTMSGSNITFVGPFGRGFCRPGTHLRSDSNCSRLLSPGVQGPLARWC